MFIIIFIALVSFSAFAQKGSSNIKIGVKAGATFATIAFSGNGSQTSNSQTLTSLFLGGNVDFPISPIFSVQPGLSIVGKGDKESDDDGNGNTSSFTTNLMYLEVPVNLLANFRTASGKFFIGAGPYFAFAVSGQSKGEVKNGSQSVSATTTLKFGTSDDSDLKGTDLGVNFLAGYELQSGLSINAGYGLGLSNLAPKPIGNQKSSNRVFSVGLGFSF